MPYIEYTGSDGRYLYFSESSEAAGAFSKDGTVREININGYAVHVIEKGPKEFEVNWATDDRWLMLNTQNMTWDETQGIIESVRRIIRENP